MPHDYLFGLLGGLLMGTACVVLVLFNGRILGVSGLLGGALKLDADSAWRWAFIAGMVAAGGLVLATHPEAFTVSSTRTLGATLAGGVLVGAGTQLGGGCTSGHGICGIGRFSRRSITATCVFMATGALAVAVIQRLLGGQL